MKYLCFSMPSKEYYKVALPVGLREEIIRLFEEFPYIKNQFDNNPVEFIRESIRRNIQRWRKEVQPKKSMRKLLVDEPIDKLAKD